MFSWDQKQIVKIEIENIKIYLRNYNINILIELSDYFCFSYRLMEYENGTGKQLPKTDKNAMKYIKITFPIIGIF